MLLGVNVAVVIFAVVLSVMLTVPETALLELSTNEKVLLVIVELSINSLKVAEILETTVFDPSDGEVEETVGAVVSEVVVVLSVVPVAEYSSFSSLQEMIVRLKQEIRKTNKNFFIFSSIPKVKYYCFVY